MASERLQIPIDRFGRVVLPKWLRERLGVRPGTEFEVEEREHAILLKPIVPQAEVIDQGGWLVLKTSSKQKITPEEISTLIDQSRERKD